MDPFKLTRERLEAISKVWTEAGHLDGSLAFLMKLVVLEQTGYENDPTGGRWKTLNPHLSEVSQAAIRKAHDILTRQ